MARAHLHPVWFAVFCAAILVGLLRESTLGDPEPDLLAAFVPFVMGTMCLLLTVRSLAEEATAQQGQCYFSTVRLRRPLQSCEQRPALDDPRSRAVADDWRGRLTGARLSGSLSASYAPPTCPPRSLLA
jgi:hypothetical protein